jgi:peptidoglycan/xylan/chitin deacetylase (PgdA/CDA1 family)
MKAVMYHYVRPAAPGLPHFPFLRLADFERQLDHFSRSYGFVGRDDFLRWSAGNPPPPGVLLTFDDGLLDHLEFVLPVLQRRGLFAMFYVLSGPESSGRLLDVHKVHLALGRLGGDAALAWLQAHAPEILPSPQSRTAGARYADQDSDAATKFVKQLFNWELTAEARRSALDGLLDHAFVGNPPAWDACYLGRTGLRELTAAGMAVGPHGHSHEIMGRLSPDRQKFEIDTSCEFVERAGGSRTWGFCYAYGSADAYSEHTKRAVAEAGCPFAFAVSSRDISAPPVGSDRYQLPRHNCNSFPHGAATCGDSDFPPHTLEKTNA